MLPRGGANMTTTDVVGSMVLDNGDQVQLFGNGITDGTGGNVKVRDISGSNTKEIGEFANGRRLRTLKLSATIGSILEYIKIYDQKGATILFARGAEQSGIYENYALVIRGLDIPLVNGVYLFAMTTD